MPSARSNGSTKHTSYAHGASHTHNQHSLADSWRTNRHGASHMHGHVRSPRGRGYLYLQLATQHTGLMSRASTAGFDELGGSMGYPGVEGRGDTPSGIRDPRLDDGGSQGTHEHMWSTGSWRGRGRSQALGCRRRLLGEARRRQFGEWGRPQPTGSMTGLSRVYIHKPEGSGQTLWRMPRRGAGGGGQLRRRGARPSRARQAKLTSATSPYDDATARCVPTIGSVAAAAVADRMSGHSVIAVIMQTRPCGSASRTSRGGRAS